MSERHLDFDLLLREKQEVIDALTEQLERTAEQLDRLQRTSGDRGHWHIGGVPTELIDRQQSLSGDLERLLQQWEAAQPTQALERIESQLDRLQQLMSSPRDRSGRDDDVCIGAMSAPSGCDSPVATGWNASGTSAWESLKAELLSQSPGDELALSPPSEQDSIHVFASEPDPFASEPVSVPVEVDIDAADVGQLRKAVIERDECIADLLKRLRVIEGKTRPTDGWKALSAVPEVLKERLETLETRLEQTLRNGEIELSMERAKLGREAARLRQREASLSRAESRSTEGTPHGNEPKPDRFNGDAAGDGRWLRMLGVKRDR